MDVFRVKNDGYGNPRYVVHYLDFIGKNEQINCLDKYEVARNRANSIGGKVYRGKDFGGGFVFQVYSTSKLISNINNLKL